MNKFFGLCEGKQKIEKNDELGLFSHCEGEPNNPKNPFSIHIFLYTVYSYHRAVQNNRPKLDRRKNKIIIK